MESPHLYPEFAHWVYDHIKMICTAAKAAPAEKQRSERALWAALTGLLTGRNRLNISDYSQLSAQGL